jgi:NAD(P)-dependent dehydrogenase (short-subunit alcohol dehydrogenase family)
MELIVITGAGGMGIACARRLGVGRRVLLADFDTARLASVAEALTGDGFDVTTQQVDVADAASVTALAARAAALGSLRTLVHTAGLSPTMADAARLYAVDLVGTALLMDAFLPLAGPGTVAVMVASMAGYGANLPPEIVRQLALAPTADLLAAVAGLPTDAASAYCVAKRGNQVRVEAAAALWGRQGGRIVSISPGIIATPMGRQEHQEQPRMAQLLAMSPVQRWGTAEDIAAAADWLASPAASFVSGIDLRVDGGVMAALRHR